jgi:hypothetical protein
MGNESYDVVIREMMESKNDWLSRAYNNEFYGKIWLDERRFSSTEPKKVNLIGRLLNSKNSQVLMFLRKRTIIRARLYYSPEAKVFGAYLLVSQLRHQLRQLLSRHFATGKSRFLTRWAAVAFVATKRKKFLFAARLPDATTNCAHHA